MGDGIHEGNDAGQRIHRHAQDDGNGSTISDEVRSCFSSVHLLNVVTCDGFQHKDKNGRVKYKDTLHILFHERYEHNLDFDLCINYIWKYDRV